MMLVVLCTLCGDEVIFDVLRSRVIKAVRDLIPFHLLHFLYLRLGRHD